jgi:hypothetical protein
MTPKPISTDLDICPDSTNGPAWAFPEPLEPRTLLSTFLAASGPDIAGWAHDGVWTADWATNGTMAYISDWHGSVTAGITKALDATIPPDSDFGMSISLNASPDAARRQGWFHLKLLDAGDNNVADVLWTDGDAGTGYGRLSAGIQGTVLYNGPDAEYPGFDGRLTLNRAGNTWSLRVNGELKGAWDLVPTRTAARVVIEQSRDGVLNSTMSVQDMQIISDVDLTKPGGYGILPTYGGSISRTSLNNRHTLDVWYVDTGGSGLNAYSIADAAPEFTLSGAAAAGVTVSGTPTRASYGGYPVYRYSFTGRFGLGAVTMRFPAGTFNDNAGNASQAFTTPFRVIGDTPPTAAPIISRLYASSATTVNVEWTRRCVNHLRYAVQRRTATTGWATVANIAPGNLAWTDGTAGLRAGVNYYYRVAAVNDFGFRPGPSTSAIMLVPAAPRAGTNLATAVPISVTRAARTYRESVGRANRNFYYSVSLARAGTLSLTLQHNSSPLCLYLLSERGTVLAAPRTRAQAISRALPSGRYFIRLFTPGGGNSMFDLKTQLV